MASSFCVLGRVSMLHSIPSLQSIDWIAFDNATHARTGIVVHHNPKGSLCSLKQRRETRVLVSPEVHRPDVPFVVGREVGITPSRVVSGLPPFGWIERLAIDKAGGNDKHQFQCFPK